ncbi:hypothetical protein PR202_ga22087 [Eleusine coracana subsp. coracana]|uniref:F-box domain-containing protein n=1 Tax=Eleusine coracana subsp. coracana TaxID=191504 RepID=A0AAV5D290_ELECO|nr:hypothetical protein PR202_ga22087 [Eleusine coracana subsp. coracana]
MHLIAIDPIGTSPFRLRRRLHHQISCASRSIVVGLEPGPGCAAMVEEEGQQGTKSGVSLVPGPEEVAAALVREAVAPPLSNNEGSRHQAKPQKMEISSGGDVNAGGEVETGDAQVSKELQMKVKELEAEIERIKKERLLQLNRNATDDNSEAASTTETTRAVMQQVTSHKPHRVDAASDISAAAAKSHISSLSEDLLLDIFLRLPSLAMLVRAACTCPEWLGAVASSPAFRRRFRELHPPILLGFFFQVYDPTLAPSVPAFPLFVPTRPKDPDLAAIVRDGDFLLTSFIDCSQGPCCWEFMDGCHAGYVLLMNSYKKLFNPSSFNVVLINYAANSRIQLTIFSSKTRTCSATPWVDFPARPDGDDNHLLQQSIKRANGLLYWVYKDFKYIISLDPLTMEFSVAELHQWFSLTFHVGKTRRGQPCIVYADRLNIGLLLHTRDGNAVDRWVLHRLVSLNTELQRVIPDSYIEVSELDVLENKDGCVFDNYFDIP